ncbi:MAG: hypothetical protein QXJ02_05840 [Candidatus Bathyarchaeia archaeon]
MDRMFKVVVSAALYVIYLMLSFVLSGELAYLFARAYMGAVAYLLLFLFVGAGTAIFVKTVLKLSKN